MLGVRFERRGGRRGVVGRRREAESDAERGRTMTQRDRVVGVAEARGRSLALAFCHAWWRVGTRESLDNKRALFPTEPLLPRRSRLGGLHAWRRSDCMQLLNRRGAREALTLASIEARAGRNDLAQLAYASTRACLDQTNTIARATAQITTSYSTTKLKTQLKTSRQKGRHRKWTSTKKMQRKA